MSPSPSRPPIPRAAGPVAPSGETLDFASQIAIGTRYIIIPRVASYGIFKTLRSTNMLTVPYGTWPSGQLLKSTVWTVIFGWWGIGLAHMPRILSQLWNGGQDVSREMLASSLERLAPGRPDLIRAEVARIVKMAPPRKTLPAVWAARGIIAFAVLSLTWIVYSLSPLGAKRPHHPDAEHLAP